MNKNTTAMPVAPSLRGRAGGEAPTAMPAAPSLRGPMRDSIGCDDENFSSPKESRLRVSGGEAPRHHLFQNNILNVLFCKTEADAASMAQQTLETFEEMVMPVPEDMKSRFLAYMLANIETAFEYGWKEAQDFAEYKQRSLPLAPPKEG